MSTTMQTSAASCSLYVENDNADVDVDVYDNDSINNDIDNDNDDDSINNDSNHDGTTSTDKSNGLVVAQELLRVANEELAAQKKLSNELQKRLDLKAASIDCQLMKQKEALWRESTAALALHDANALHNSLALHQSPSSSRVVAATATDAHAESVSQTNTNTQRQR